MCAECLPLVQAVYPDSQLEPPVTPPAEKAEKIWQREEAITDLVRGRLQAAGPITARDMAETLGLSLSEINIALIELESEGFVMRGRFTPEASNAEATQAGDATLEWCERRLLARIHRYTIKTLRAEIEPVSGADFMRFLLDWQGVARRPKPEGVESLAAVISQLEGYEIPAAAWESDVLAARLNEYDPHWLDSLCLSGRALWARLTPAEERRQRAGAHHAHRARHAQELVAVAFTRGRSASRSAAVAWRARVVRLLHHARRVLLRRSRERDQPASIPGGDGARRARVRGSRERGQLFGSACAADPERQEAPARGAPPARGVVRPRRRRTLEPHP